MTDPRPTTSLDKIVLRLPDGLRAKLNDAARENGRSANSEAVKALEQWLATDPALEPPFMRLPERIRLKVFAAAALSGRAVIDEIAARLLASFQPEGPRHVEGEQLDLRAEIRSAMHEAIEGLLSEPEKLRLFGERVRRADNDGPVSG